MVEIAISVAAKIAEYLVAPVARPFSHFWNYKTNLENLKNEAETLKARRGTVERLIKDGEQPLPDVKIWQENVKKIIDEASELINEDNPEQTNTQCCKWFSSPYLLKRYQRSKKAAGKLKDVDRFWREGGEFREYSRPTITKQPWLQSNEDYEAFESRTYVLKKIMVALRNPDVNKVGIHGMGGVGKTTLAKEVGREAERDKLFDYIVFVQVSDSPDIKDTQGVIAEYLNLKLTEETLLGRASKLYDELKKKKKILLILDNIWGTVDFKEVGIPLEEDHKELKLLLTTRSYDVLTNHKVESQHQFPINILNETDAWSLFKSKAGTSIEKPDLKPIATKIAKKCGGMPIAIVAMAKALKNKGRNEWKNALRELTTPSSKSFGGIGEEVYRSIKLSYDYLENEELKEIFLLCCRMGCTYDASIQDLFRYGFGLGLFDKINTMEEALCNAYALVNKLKATSLLLGAPDSEMFAIHDVICDVARLMASRDQHVFTVIDDVIPRFLANENTLGKCTSITLHNIGELPGDLRFVCPELKFLYLKPKQSVSRILDNFFEQMSKLQVLHLVEMDLQALPTSLSCLKNLQALCLVQCELGDITVIGNLKKLEILSFRGSYIVKLPEEIRHLTGLKLLDLTDCSKLSVIPPNVMSNLTKLEALYMGNTSIRWEVERPNIERSNVSIDELKDLRYLTLLEIHIPDPNMSKCLLSPKLERYKLFIGHKRKGLHWINHSKTSRMLKLSLNTNADGVISQLKGIEELELGEVLGATNLLDALDRNGFPTLKHLDVNSNSHCSGIIESCDALPLLESLHVWVMPGLEKICNSPLGANSFLRLRIINVYNCPKLNNIFSSSTITVLQQLEEIDVFACKNIEEIFAIGGQDDANNTELVNEIKFSPLRIMVLKSLPRLKSFCCEVKTASALQLTSVIPTSLFNSKVVSPNLQTLHISHIRVEKIWHNLAPTMSSCVQNLAKLIVHRCGNLKELFTSSIVVTDEAREEERRDTILFPKLNFLRIEYLGKLTTLWPGYYIEFPILKEFRIESCPKLEAFIFDDKVIVPSLEKMEIHNMDNLKMIWHNQLDQHSFRKLKSLQVKKCEKLLTVFPSNIDGRFLTLESLNVRKCGSLEERNSIVEPQSRDLCFSNLQELNVSECQSLKYLFAASNRFLFPKLTSLKLYNLPELRTFYLIGRHTVEVPVLKTLELCDCGIHDTDEGQMQQPQFLVEEAFPCLEELKLAGKNVMMMWQGQVLESLFDKLKILEVESDDSAGLPLCIIQRFQNLEKLSIDRSSYKEIFSNGEDQIQMVAPTKIKTLILFQLEDVKYMWKPGFKLDLILQTLEVLNVYLCNSLINVMPPSASFRNLTVMEVHRCSSLINIGTSSAAKSLVQLTQMRIFDCENIIEVVGNHGDVTEDKIIFPKLKSLSLLCLPSLTSFCSWNVTLEFPSLEEIIVIKCPQMKIFSQGVLTTQTLLKVEIDEESIELRPDIVINKAIQQFHENVNAKNMQRLQKDNKLKKAKQLDEEANVQSSIKDCEGSSSHHLEIRGDPI